MAAQGLGNGLGSLLARHPNLYAATAILAPFLLSRLAIIAIGSTALALFGINPHPPPLLCRWDCRWYSDIIVHGYTQTWPANQIGASNYNFFPLYPLLGQALNRALGIDAVTAGLIVSNAAFLGALAYVYAYSRLVGLAAPVAAVAVATVCVLPMTIVFSSVYAESLFVLLLAAAMYHLRREQFLRSGIAAALLSATRSTGILFVAFAGVWLVMRYRAGLVNRLVQYPQTLLPITLAPLGLLAFSAFSFATTGDAFAYASAGTHGWQQSFANPVVNILNDLTSNPRDQLWITSSLAAFIASLWLLRMRLFAEFVFCLANFLVFWSIVVPWGQIRYSIVLFPIWIGLADALGGHRRRVALGLGALAVISAWLVVEWSLSDPITI